MTDAERFLWSRVRRKQLKGFQFYRQKNIGNYIVDFYCPAAKLIVEIDGGQHYSERKKRTIIGETLSLVALGLRFFGFQTEKCSKISRECLKGYMDSYN